MSWLVVLLMGPALEVHASLSGNPWGLALWLFWGQRVGAWVLGLGGGILPLEIGCTGPRDSGSSSTPRFSVDPGLRCGPLVRWALGASYSRARLLTPVWTLYREDGTLRVGALGRLR